MKAWTGCPATLPARYAKQVVECDIIFAVIVDCFAHLVCLVTLQS